MGEREDEADFVVQQERMLRRGDGGEEVMALQRRLHQAGLRLAIDGDYGPATERAVCAFQRRVGLVADGIAGPKTLQALRESPPDERLLQQADLEWAAAELGVPVAAVMAVNEVESRGSGFFPNDRPAILFERHIMYRRLRQHGLDPAPHRARHPELVNPSSGGYAGGVREYDRLTRAQRIHHDSALESASWGLFQIMGFHWQHLGYDSARHYVECMHRGERDHLDAFVRFIGKDRRLHDSLRDQDWARFARYYNGPAYARNRYDEKMARAFARHSQALGDRGMLA